MLIKMFLFVESFLTVSTLPFIYIYMRFMLFLISIYIIVRVKPAPS
uniref:Transmembrane protein n=1 Tax=Medicago truncatula TaxID=3880 RepID=I3SC63_MEDTR|nr:unknown [Medicago truncatula]AFK48317.1 unknown [Medicago truncatula]